MTFDFMNPLRSLTQWTLSQRSVDRTELTTPTTSGGGTSHSPNPVHEPTSASDVQQRAGYLNTVGRRMSQQLHTSTPATQELDARQHGTATAPVDTADLELASYFLARDLTQRPLTAAQETLLRRVNQSKKEVLGIMRFGRSNVEPDLQATRNAGLYRIRAQRTVLNSVSSLGQSEEEALLQSAAIVALAGAGCCNEFADLSTVVHAGQMQEFEQSHEQYVDGKIDHAWTLVQGRADEQGNVPQAVLDVWGEGPVVDPADAYFCSGEAGEVHELRTIAGSQGPSLRARFDDVLSLDPESNTQARRLQAAVRAEYRKAKPVGGARLFEPTEIVSPAFAEAARAAVTRQSPARLRASAIDAVVRAVPTPLPSDEAEKMVDTVIDMVRTLDQARPRNLDTSGNLSIAVARPRFSLEPDDGPPSQRRRFNP